MSRVSQKVPRALIDLYRIALKGVKIESFREEDLVHVWARNNGDNPFERFWAIFSHDGIEVIEEDLKNQAKFKITETIGIGIINVRRGQ